MVYAFRTQKNPAVNKSRPKTLTEQTTSAFLAHMNNTNQNNNTNNTNSSKMNTKTSIRATLHQQLLGTSSSTTIGDLPNKIPSFGGFNSPNNNTNLANNTNNTNNNNNNNTQSPSKMTFGSARNNNFSSKYRMLAGAPTSYSSGGGFMRSISGAGSSLTSVGRGWGQSSSIAVQLAEARASLLQSDSHAPNFALSKAFSATSPGTPGGRNGIFYRKEQQQQQELSNSHYSTESPRVPIGERKQQGEKKQQGQAHRKGSSQSNQGSNQGSNISNRTRTRSSSARSSTTTKSKRFQSLRQGGKRSTSSDKITAARERRERDLHGPDYKKPIKLKNRSRHTRNNKKLTHRRSTVDELIIMKDRKVTRKQPKAPIKSSVVGFLSPLKGAQPRLDELLQAEDE